MASEEYDADLTAFVARALRLDDDALLRSLLTSYRVHRPASNDAAPAPTAVSKPETDAKSKTKTKPETKIKTEAKCGPRYGVCIDEDADRIEYICSDDAGRRMVAFGWPESFSFKHLYLKFAKDGKTHMTLNFERQPPGAIDAFINAVNLGAFHRVWLAPSHCVISDALLIQKVMEYLRANCVFVESPAEASVVSRFIAL